MVDKWHVIFTKQADKNAKKAKAAGYKPKLDHMINSLTPNPFYEPLPEKLGGDMAGSYSRRINKQHRLVYQVLFEEKTIKVIRMWTHYE